VGQRAKDIMARGELVPDDVVVAIVAERIDEPDARKGFILDGFPRTVPQAHALDRMLAEKGLKLDAVIELKVDEGILLKRIEKRIAEMKARGAALRPDDNPEVLRRRLLAYRDQTAPLVTYYRLQNQLRSVDGMAPIEAVASAIDQSLRPPAKKPAKEAAKEAIEKQAARKKAPKKVPGKALKTAPGRDAKVKSPKSRAAGGKTVAATKPRAGKAKSGAGRRSAQGKARSRKSKRSRS
jgi:adenylate kinase